MPTQEWIAAQRAAFALSMDGAGAFWRAGERFEHRKIVAFLRRHIEREQGQYVVRLGAQWVPLEVQDLPVRVRHLRAQEGQSDILHLVLDDGRQEVGSPVASLRSDAHERVSCTVPSASGRTRLEARLGNAALMQLAQHLEGLDDPAPRYKASATATPITLGRFYCENRDP